MSFTLSAEVDLAVSNAQKGPAAELGKALNKGARLYFSNQNEHTVNLHTKDDGYEPELALINTREFYKEGHQVLFNYVGTPTTKAIFNFIKAKKMKLIAPYTGADFLRKSDNTNIFNLRSSYEKEAQAQVQLLVQELNLTNIAIVIQADAFGLALEKYFIKFLNHHNLTPSVVARFKRNTDQVEKAVIAINHKQPQAVIFVGTYIPMARLVKTIIPSAPNTIFTTVSFISSQHLLERVPKQTKLIVSEVVPNPNTCDFSECVEIRNLLPNQKISHGAFEGYLNAKWINVALTLCKDNNKFGECIANGLTNNSVELLGETRRFNFENRQLLQKVYFTKLNLP